MRKSILILFSVLTLIVLGNISANAQTYGKLLTRMEADSVVTEVVDSLTIPSKQLEKELNKTGQVVMFSIKNKKVKILGDNKQPLFPETKMHKKGEEFVQFSVALVRELLSLAESEEINLEIRKEQFTLSGGDYVLLAGEVVVPDNN